ncbi:cytochrome c biogenesis B [Tanacetum coccineum]
MNLYLCTEGPAAAQLFERNAVVLVPIDKGRMPGRRSSTVGSRRVRFGSRARTRNRRCTILAATPTEATFLSALFKRLASARKRRQGHKVSEVASLSQEGPIRIPPLFPFPSAPFPRNEKEDGTLELYYLSAYCLPKILLLQLVGHRVIQISRVFRGFPMLQLPYQFGRSGMDRLNIPLGSLVLTFLCGIHSRSALGITSSSGGNSSQNPTTSPTSLPLTLSRTSIETEWFHVLSPIDLGPWNPKKVRTPTCPMLLRPNTIYKWDLHYAQAVRKNHFFFLVLKKLGRNRVLPGNHGFFSFRHWLLVEPLEWNEIRISGDLSSPLTRNRLSLCRRLLPNGIIGRLIPRSSKKTDSSYSFFSFRIGSSLVLLSLMI